jgi:phosphoglycolate phosphatase-like HAD superfamily hydrolase
MQYAADQLKKTYNVSKFDSIVYVGDGPWDITAVKKLGWGFIGIASGYSAAQLMAWGAKSVVKDYLALNDFFIQLDAARRLFLAD